MALIVPATSVYVLGANVEPPLKQMKSMPTGGVIVCNDGLELVLKSHDRTPACVKPDTKVILIARGWGIDVITRQDLSHAKDAMEDAMEENAIEDAKDAMNASKAVGTVKANATAGMAEDGPVEVARTGNMMAKEASSLDLTEEEARLLASTTAISVAYDPGWAPIEFVDGSGSVQGITKGYIAEFEALTGADFVPAELDSWTDALDAIRDGRADVMFMVGMTEKRSEYMDFTEPHTTLSWDMITSDEMPVAAEEIATLKVGTIADYEIEEWLDENGIAYTSFEDHATALGALGDGSIDVFIEVYVVAAAHAAENAEVGPIYDAGPVGHDIMLSVGFPKDQTVLNSILAKALDAIPEEQRTQMLDAVTPAVPT